MKKSKVAEKGQKPPAKASRHLRSQSTGKAGPSGENRSIPNSQTGSARGTEGGSISVSLEDGQTVWKVTSDWRKPSLYPQGRSCRVTLCEDSTMEAGSEKGLT